MSNVESMKMVLDILMVVLLWFQSKTLQTNQERFEFIPRALVTIALLLI